MNRTYFEPKQLNEANKPKPRDEVNLLDTDTDNDLTDDDIELGQQINHNLASSSAHLALIDRTDTIPDLDTTNRCHEWIRATAWTIKQSVQFFLVYLVLIVLNAFVLIWELSDGGDRKICIILEGLITLMFMGEVAVQIVTEEWSAYWASWLNRIDLVVCTLCVFLYIVFASVADAPHSHYSVGNYMDAILVGIRYGMQAIRLLRFAQRGHENRKMLNQTEIVFDTHTTLNVLEQHGLHTQTQTNQRKGRTGKTRKSRTKQARSAFETLTNRLFNPTMSSLLHRADSNELRTLKENSSPQTQREIEICQMPSNVQRGKKSENVESSEEQSMEDIAAPITPHRDRDREAEVFTYSTDEFTDREKQFVDAYDSEQMRVYDDILQHAQTESEAHTPRARSEDTERMRIPF